MSSSGAPTPPAFTAIADYRLLARADDGSTAVLYRAEAPARLGLTAGTVVVVKLLEGTGDRAFSRLSRLLQTFAAVHHPSLVPLLDAGQHEDIFFYATPDWPGGSLARPASPLAPSAAVAAVADAARAAHALHETGIAHRDISPSTVLLHQAGAWLGGLDLARAALGGGSVTSMSSLHSVGYVDPAVIKGDQPSRASDIYSLGATLHFALTGRGVHPDLPENDAVMAVRRVLRDAPQLADELDEVTRRVIVGCLDADPALRPLTAEGLAEQLDDVAQAYRSQEGSR